MADNESNSTAEALVTLSGKYDTLSDQYSFLKDSHARLVAERNELRVKLAAASEKRDRYYIALQAAQVGIYRGLKRVDAFKAFMERHQLQPMFDEDIRIERQAKREAWLKDHPELERR